MAKLGSINIMHVRKITKFPVIFNLDKITKHQVKLDKHTSKGVHQKGNYIFMFHQCQIEISGNQQNFH